MRSKRSKSRVPWLVLALPLVIPSCDGKPPPDNPVAPCLGLVLLLFVGKGMHWLLQRGLMNGGHIIAYLWLLGFGYGGNWTIAIQGGFAIHLVATWVLLEISKNESLREFADRVSIPVAAATISVVSFLSATYFARVVVTLLRGRIPWPW